jgi:homoserine O-succinyltransferase/O-acetyltransferase
MPDRIRPLTIGLVNNMQEAAFKATERQFLSLLNEASRTESIPIRVSLYTLPRVGETGQRTPSRYSNVEILWNRGLDGLIVTGREPLSPDLRNEPYWQSFTQLLEWAREHTHSTIWSCLAAHAAVLHMDGIARRKRGDKHFGVFECANVGDHALLVGLLASHAVPHSRWNGLFEQDLAMHGYSVLTRTSDAEVDGFIKQERSLFVFFQGHPEYETDTLMREYRRDVARYLRRESDTYPQLPHDYFDSRTADALTALHDQAISHRSKEQLRIIAAVLEKAEIGNTWRPASIQTYRNWLRYLRAGSIA